MNRNRVLMFLLGLGVLAGVGVVVFLMFQDPSEPARGPVDIGGPAVRKPAPSPEGLTRPVASEKPVEGAAIKPKSFEDTGAYAQEAGIGGVVQNEAGARIESAVCELYEDTAAIKDKTQEGELRDKQSSNSEGLFLFDRNSLSLSERYLLKVSHPMYRTERKAIDLRKPEAIVTVVLKTGTSISGVVRAANGAPLPSATVTVFDMNQGALDPNGSVETSMTTDQTGAYTIGHVCAGIKKIQASLQGYASTDRQAVQVEEGKPLQNVDFALNEGASITGVVRSSEGTPVGGAYVVARPVRVGPKPDPNAAPEGAREIQVQRERDAKLRERAIQRPSEGDSADAGEAAEEVRRAIAAEDARLQKEAMLAKERDGQRDGSAKRVSVPHQPAVMTTLSVRSAPDGTFVITGTEIGTYIVSVNAPGFIPPPQQTLDSPSAGATFSLAPNARILGRVIDDETQKPVSMFTIGLTQTPDEVLIPAHTKKPFGPPKFKDGSFEYVDVRPGRFWLLADAPGYAGGRSGEIVISQGERREGVEIRLVRGATIKGRVVDAKGAPVAAASVKPEPASLSGSGAAGMFLQVMMQNVRRDDRDVKTDSDGHYTIPNMLSGSYTVSVRHNDFGPFTSQAFTVPLSGEITQPDIALSRGASIRGRVLLKDGQPDAKAMVQVTPVGSGASFGGHRTAYTDANGVFEANGLAVGQYRVVVAQRNGQPDLTQLFTQMKNPNLVTLGEGEVKEMDL